jgi:hypothetical protein
MIPDRIRANIPVIKTSYNLTLIILTRSVTDRQTDSADPVRRTDRREIFTFVKPMRAWGRPPSPRIFLPELLRRNKLLI